MTSLLTFLLLYCLKTKKKYGKNISDTLNGSCASFAFSPHFDVICYLLLNRRTASWNLFVEQTGFKVSG